MEKMIRTKKIGMRGFAILATLIASAVLVSAGVFVYLYQANTTITATNMSHYVTVDRPSNGLGPHPIPYDDPITYTWDAGKVYSEKYFINNTATTGFTVNLTKTGFAEPSLTVIFEDSSHSPITSITVPASSSVTLYVKYTLDLWTDATMITGNLSFTPA